MKTQQMKTIRLLLLIFLVASCGHGTSAQTPAPAFSVIAFYTERNDQAHISFVHEANQWFARMGAVYHFTYDSTRDWTHLNAAFLSPYRVVLFLDTRPDAPEQRQAFQKYMEGGGAWMGFHFSAFALTPSDFPQDWDWYHSVFLGSGAYVSNTWRPVSAIGRVEDRSHPATSQLPETFKTAPSEWYRWSNDLRKNPDIRILVSIDSSSFPLGTGPKPSEIWHSGYYPIVWTNRRYKMIYFNMGHNDIDYEHHTDQALSSTFSSPVQDSLIIHSLLWLGKRPGQE
jgi:uncharacterized protein